MVWHLPPDSALHRELSGGWTTANELAAVTAEVMFAQYRATLASGGVKKYRLPPPLSIPRPEPTLRRSYSERVGTTDTSPVSARPAHQRHRRHATTVEEVVSVLAHGFGPRR